MIINGMDSFMSIMVYDLLLVMIAGLKPHYALIGVSVAVFAAKKRRFLLFLTGGILITVLSLILYNFLFPVHLSVWAIRLYEMFTGVGTGSTALAYSLNKWKRLFFMFFPVFIMSAYGIFYEIRLAVKSRKSGLKDRARGNIHIIWINAAINALALTYLSRHDGADLWYFYFMLMPSLIMLSMYYVKTLASPDSTGTSDNARKRELLVYGVFMLLVFAGLLNTFILMSPRPKYINRWRTSHEEAYDILDAHKSDEMLLSSPLAYY